MIRSPPPAKGETVINSGKAIASTSMLLINTHGIRRNIRPEDVGATSPAFKQFVDIAIILPDPRPAAGVHTRAYLPGNTRKSGVSISRITACANAK